MLSWNEKPVELILYGIVNCLIRYKNMYKDQSFHVETIELSLENHGIDLKNHPTHEHPPKQHSYKLDSK